jgi:hypothetical protein
LSPEDGGVVSHICRHSGVWRCCNMQFVLLREHIASPVCGKWSVLNVRVILSAYIGTWYIYVPRCFEVFKLDAKNIRLTFHSCYRAS